MKDEFINQAQALRIIGGEMTLEQELEIIDKYAAEFREIIDGLKRDLGRVPTVDDFLFIASKHAGRDLRKG